MKYLHRNLADGDWNQLSLIVQMANIGSEIFRTIKWKNKNNNNAQAAFFRALELLALTLQDKKNIHRLKEISRVKEMLVDWYLETKLYNSTDSDWEKYFFQFNLAARKNN